MMTKRPAFTAALLLVLLLQAPASAADNAEESHRLPNGGVLTLPVPEAWQRDVSRPPNGMPPTIHFTPRGGDSFDIQVTPIWALNPDMVLPDRAGLRAGVEAAIEEIRPQSVDAGIAIKELKSASAFGYYFSATDKAPKPGEFRYMTQGMVRLAELVLTFTILTNDGAGNVVGEMIAAIEGAKYETTTHPPKKGVTGSRRSDSI